MSHQHPAISSIFIGCARSHFLPVLDANCLPPDFCLPSSWDNNMSHVTGPILVFKFVIPMYKICY
jgi:hypothetical protein